MPLAVSKMWCTSTV